MTAIIEKLLGDVSQLPTIFKHADPAIPILIAQSATEVNTVKSFFTHET